MAKTLIIYSTTDGHTTHICERISEVITNNNNICTIINVGELINKDVEKLITEHDKVVIGASIRYGKHSQLIYNLINAYQPLIENKPNALFSVNVVARKSEKSSPLTNPYLQKFLKQISWKPKKLAVFAGRLDYPSYSTFDREMIRFIMWMTKGPTASDTVIEYTDWYKVDEFAQEIAKM